MTKHGKVQVTMKEELGAGARRAIKAGFTLIEILVVVGIISLLAAILFPVFGRVREKGRSATCQSNLKQLYLAVQQYVQDNDGAYPRRWNRDGSMWAHSVFPYIKSAEVFRCPTISEPPEPGSNLFRSLYNTVYSYNIHRLNHHVSLAFPNRVGRSESALSRYSTTIFLNVCRPEPKYVETTHPERIPTSCGRVMELEGNVRHHSGGTNWSFLDGHVKWLTPEQLAELSCANPLDHIGPTTDP